MSSMFWMAIIIFNYLKFKIYNCRRKLVENFQCHSENVLNCATLFYLTLIWFGYLAILSRCIGVVFHTWCSCMLLCCRPIGWCIMHWWPLSVRPMPDPKSRTEGCRKLKISRREAHDTGDPWPHLEVKGQGHQVVLTPWLKITHIFKTKIWVWTSDLVYGWSMMTRIANVCGDLQAQSSGWLF